MTWTAHIDKDFMRQQISLRFVNRHPDGGATYYTDMGSSSTNNSRPQELYYVPAHERDDDKHPQMLPLQLEEDAWRAIMEELQRHFGVYVGVDYDRLRADYDRMVTDLRTAREELKEVNEFIREQLDIATAPRDRAAAPVARNRPRGRKADAEAGGSDQ